MCYTTYLQTLIDSILLAHKSILLESGGVGAEGGVCLVGDVGVAQRESHRGYLRVSYGVEIVFVQYEGCANACQG